ncbi:hypothetical protein [Paenibacillus sp. PvR052]
MDVSVSKQLGQNEMNLVLDCMNGLPHDLRVLQDGALITMKHDDAERQVLVTRGKGDECGFHYIEVGTETANALRLRDGVRYRVHYDESTKILTLTRALVSRVQVPLKTDRKKKKEPTVTIGYALLCMLGMAEKRPSLITLNRGSVTVKLRLSVPNNELDRGFLLSSEIAAMLGLTQGQACLLEYNQSTKVLTLSASGVPSRMVTPQQKTGKDKQNLNKSRNLRTTYERREPVSAKSQTKSGTPVKRHRSPASKKPAAALTRSTGRLNGSLTKKLR